MSDSYTLDELNNLKKQLDSQGDENYSQEPEENSLANYQTDDEEDSSPAYPQLYQALQKNSQGDSTKPTQPSSPAAPPAAKTDYATLLNKAIEQRNKDQGLAMMVAGANQVGAGIARTAVPDQSALKEYQKNADDQVKDVGTKQAVEQEQMKLDLNKEAADPNSAVSMAARERLRQALPDVDKIKDFDKLSAAQLEKMGLKVASATSNMKPLTKNIQDADGNVHVMGYNYKTGRFDIDQGTAGYAPRFGKDSEGNVLNAAELAKQNKAKFGINGMKNNPGAIGESSTDPNSTHQPLEDQVPSAPTPVDFTELTPNRRKDASALQKQFATENKLIRNSRDRVDPLVEHQVDLATQNASAANLLANEVALVVTQGKPDKETLDEARTRAGFSNKLNDLMQRSSDGTILPERADEIKQLLTAYKQSMDGILKQRAQEKANVFTARYPEYKGRDVTPLIYNPTQSTSSAPSSSSHQAPPNLTGLAPNEEPRKTQDGRVAIFDKDTKKFIRYQ